MRISDWSSDVCSSDLGWSVVWRWLRSDGSRGLRSRSRRRRGHRVGPRPPPAPTRPHRRHERPADPPQGNSAMTDTYDLIVIGAGMAGAAAANKCTSEGWKVAIVDELPYGGPCALRGCDPKKILRRGAEIIASPRLMAGPGIDRLDERREGQEWVRT